MVDILNEYVKSQKIKELFALVEEKVELAPICVPSYKFRKEARILRSKEKFSCQKVYVFVYEDDYVESGYDRYENFQENVEFVKISKKDFEENGLFWRGIAPKRAYIQRYMRKLGISKYFMVDDDISTTATFSASQRNNACKSCYMEKVSLDNVLKLAQFVGENNPEYKVIGFPFTAMKAQFFSFKELLVEQATNCVVFFNDLPEGIEYRDNVKLSEDYDFFFTCKKNGVKVGVIPFVAIDFNFENSVCGHNSVRPLADYVEHPDYIDLKVTSKGILGSKINYVRLRHQHPKEIDQKLMEFCRNENVEAAKEYLLNNKAAKRSIISENE